VIEMVTLAGLVGLIIAFVPFGVVIGLPAYGAYYLSKNYKFAAIGGIVGFGAGIVMGIIPFPVVALVGLIGVILGFFTIRKRLLGGV
jgi:hypothetical protein